MSSERDQAGPPSTVPTTTSVEPPPTSQTATLEGRVQLAATAPAKASLPSSSALRTRTGTPVAAASSRTKLAGVRALAAGRRDDHLHGPGAEPARGACVGSRAARRLGDPRLAEPAVALDVLAEEEVLARLLAAG